MSLIVAKNICFSINNKNILNGIDLKVEKGDFISIVGPSGSGKSTLLKILSDLQPLSSGDLFYKDKNYSTYVPTEIRKEIVYCFQKPYLFGETIFDNFSFVYNIRKEEINLERIHYLMEVFELSNKNLDDSITGLSGGEVQRIALIRALLFLPEVLLLDEVTSALDANNKQIVNLALKKINNDGVTILYITHDIDRNTDYANKILTIQSGKIESLEVIR